MDSNFQELVNQITERYSIDTSTYIEDNAELNVQMQDVPKEYLPGDQRMFIASRTVNLAIVHYTFPIIGNSHLLRYTPNTYTHNPPQGEIIGSNIHFSIITGCVQEELTQSAKDKAKMEAKENIYKVREWLNFAKKDCVEFNKYMQGRIPTLITQ